MRFSVLASGSSGNATYVETDRTRLLIDAGLSVRETGRRLAQIGRSLDDLDLILISHEHDDHARGLEALTKRHKLTVAASRGTLGLLHDRLAPGTDRLELPAGRPTRAADLEIEAIRIPHDAVDPIGFRIGHGAAQFGHVTDLGSINRTLESALEPVTALVLESNHDSQMLNAGPYPWSLKRRLLGPLGHLANDAVADYLRRGPLADLALLYLAHLSRTNNRPALALNAARVALDARGSEAELYSARPDEASPLREVPAASGRADRPARVERRPPLQLLIPFALWPARARARGDRRQPTPST